MRTTQLVLSALALGAPLLLASPARAGIEACGNTHLEADAQCEVQGGIQCEAQCEPVSFQLQCSADLTVQCNGQCQGMLSLDAQCQTDCEGTCSGQCMADPGNFDCQGSCFADCYAAAMGQCSGSAGGGSASGDCDASVRATCDSQCSVSCQGTPPSVDCNAGCMASCEGSCEASGQAYLDCQVNCQSSGYADCEANMQGGCKADCQTEQGALFCNGQYVDHGGNLKSCVDALKALLNIEVSGYADASCSGNSCMADAGFSCACTADGESHHGRDAALLTAGVLLLLGVSRARRRMA